MALVLPLGSVTMGGYTLDVYWNSGKIVFKLEDIKKSLGINISRSDVEVLAAGYYRQINEELYVTVQAVYSLVMDDQHMDNRELDVFRRKWSYYMADTLVNAAVAECQYLEEKRKEM